VGRAPALLALAATLAAWYELAPHLDALTVWGNDLLVSLVLMPAVFGLAWLALPASQSRYLPVFTGASLAVAVLLTLLGSHVSASFAKFVALTAVGWLFLRLFEALSWVVLVALIIPWIDAYSVWRGPTRAITTNHPQVFTRVSVAFVTPAGRAALLGLPDVMFFALFLAASVRFGLRPRATWIAMTVGLGITITLTTIWSTNGLPALPGIALGFLLPNADLIWRRLVRSGQPSVEPSGG
jgi:hypothetical protein